MRKLDHLPLVRGYRVDAEAGIVYGLRGEPIRAHNGNGYLQTNTKRGGRAICHKAHRLVWEAARGPIPEGLEPNHINGVRDDNRIANLELVTRSENILHAIEHLGRPVLRGESHGMARLTDRSVVEARQRFDAGERVADLASAFGVSWSAMADVCHRRTWTHVGVAA